MTEQSSVLNTLRSETLIQPKKLILLVCLLVFLFDGIVVDYLIKFIMDDNSPWQSLLEALINAALLFIILTIFALPKIQKAERNYTTAVQNLLSIIDHHCIFAVTNKQGNIIDANSKFAELSGYEIDELIGKNHRILNSGYFNKEQWKQFYSTLGKGNVWQGIIRNKAKDGRLYWVYTTVKPIFVNNKLQNCYVLRSDVTSMITQANQAMQAFDDLQSAEQRLTNFVNHIVHELRTPIHIITNFNNILFSKMKQQVNIDMLHEVQSTVDHMKELVDELLDLSKIKQGRFELHTEDFDLHDFLNKVGSEFKATTTNSAISIHLEIDASVPRYINADKTRLKQVIYNLASNARKFTKQGSITIASTLRTFHSNRSEMQSLSISVTDTGIGIKPEDMHKIFGEFYQVRSEQAALGTGLGLTISRQIVNMMGGDIYLDSTFGKGSTFTIEIPYIDAEVIPQNRIAQTAAINLSDDALKGRRILAVDDTPMNILLAEQILAKFGATVISTLDPRNALAYFRENSTEFDAILIDLHMPEMDGIELTKLIRQTEKGLDIPIIGLSGSFDEDEAINNALAAGMTDTLKKPFDIRLVVSVLNRHLNSAEQTRSLDG